MKPTKRREMIIDDEGTQKIRSLAKSKKIKITINIDLENIQKVKKMAEKNGASYQKLLNQLIDKALKQDDASSVEHRLARLEKKFEKLKMNF